MAISGLECLCQTDLMELPQIVQDENLSARHKTRLIVKKYASFSENKRSDQDYVREVLKVTKNYKILCHAPDALMNNGAFMTKLIQEGIDVFAEVIVLSLPL